MAIKDFKCAYGNASGINAQATAHTGISFPHVHHDSQMMAQLSLALKGHYRAPFCSLPFCHTVEAEAFGGIVNLGDAETGPRTSGYVAHSIDDILYLPDIDFTKGRISKVLEACRILSEAGEHVMIEVCGPITVMSSLMDPKHIFKAIRRDRSAAQAAFNKIGSQMMRYMEQAKASGAQLISYADVVGGVNIVGPKMAEDIVDFFTYPFVEQISQLSDDGCLVMLCPKTTFALLGCDKAQFRDVTLEEPLSYGEACIQLIGKVSLAGMTCCKNMGFTLKDKTFKEVILM